MATSKRCMVSALLLLWITALLSPTASGQLISCTTTMIMSFTPCINFVTGSTGGSSSGNGSGNAGGFKPSEDCCKAMAKMVGSGTDCMCSMIGGVIPFGLPINQSFSYRLPAACGTPSTPLFQCKGSSGNGSVPLPPFGLPPPIVAPPPPAVPVNTTGESLKPFSLPNAAAMGRDVVITVVPTILMVVQVLLLFINP